MEREREREGRGGETDRRRTACLFPPTQTFLLLLPSSSPPTTPPTTNQPLGPSAALRPLLEFFLSSLFFARGEKTGVFRPVFYRSCLVVDASLPRPAATIPPALRTLPPPPGVPLREGGRGGGKAGKGWDAFAVDGRSSPCPGGEDVFSFLSRGLLQPCDGRGCHRTFDSGSHLCRETGIKTGKQTLLGFFAPARCRSNLASQNARLPPVPPLARQTPRRSERRPDDGEREGAFEKVSTRGRPPHRPIHEGRASTNEGKDRSVPRLCAATLHVPVWRNLPTRLSQP